MPDILTWNSDLDNVTADSSTVLLTSKSLLFELHKALLATGAWVAVTSCAFVGGFQTVGAGNLFSPTFVATEWVNAASPTNHSWIQYYCAGLDIYFTIDVVSSVAAYAPAAFYFCKEAPTVAGLITTRPSNASMEWGHIVNYSQINDNTANVNKLNMVYSTRGDFWVWTYRTGGSGVPTHESWAVVCTGIADPDPVYGDNYPVVTYMYYSTAGAFSNIWGYGAWRGRTAGGSLTGGTSGNTSPYMTQMVRADASYETYGPSPLVYWPIGGGQWRKKFPYIPIDLYVVDTTAPYSLTDYKGRLPDVAMGSGNIAHGAPMDNPVTRRAIHYVWLPGMPLAGPTR